MHPTTDIFLRETYAPEALGSVTALLREVKFLTADQPDIDPRAWFGPGTWSCFASLASGEVIGMSRCFSDDVVATYLSEICVHPKWQRRGVGTRLLAAASRRFQHTTFYTLCFRGQERFFAKAGIAAKSRLVPCGRRILAPLPPARPDHLN